MSIVIYAYEVAYSHIWLCGQGPETYAGPYTLRWLQSFQVDNAIFAVGFARPSRYMAYLMDSHIWLWALKSCLLGCVEKKVVF